LPTFLSETFHYSNSQIANISSVFDFGAICGSVGLGYLSDKIYSKRTIMAMIAVCSSMIISYVITFKYIQMSLVSFYICMYFFGFFEAGLSNIISASCSSDLGKNQQVATNSKATSTITGIIDGTGSLGTACG
jgi:sugar phosphate permease